MRHFYVGLSAIDPDTGNEVRGDTKFSCTGSLSQRAFEHLKEQWCSCSGHPFTPSPDNTIIRFVVELDE